jgi:hypothetical protein
LASDFAVNIGVVFRLFSILTFSRIDFFTQFLAAAHHVLASERLLYSRRCL